MQVRFGLLKRHPVWLSLLLHIVAIFIFLFFSVNTKKFAPRDIQAEIYVPSFLYQQSSRGSISNSNFPRKSNAEVAEKYFKDALSLAASQPQSSSTSPPSPSLPLKVSKKTSKEDPVHVIGEKLMDDPLRKLLGVALTRHLIYPRAAQQLRLRGTVSVELMLHPNGDITHIRLLQSSKESLLDAAALSAIHDMAPVHNVDLYIKEAKMLVFNVIFH